MLRVVYRGVLISAQGQTYSMWSSSLSRRCTKILLYRVLLYMGEELTGAICALVFLTWFGFRPQMHVNARCTCCSTYGTCWPLRGRASLTCRGCCGFARDFLGPQGNPTPATELFKMLIRSKGYHSEACLGNHCFCEGLRFPRVTIGSSYMVLYLLLRHVQLSPSTNFRVSRSPLMAKSLPVEETLNWTNPKNYRAYWSYPTCHCILGRGQKLAFEAGNTWRQAKTTKPGSLNLRISRLEPFQFDIEYFKWMQTWKIVTFVMHFFCFWQLELSCQQENRKNGIAMIQKTDAWCLSISLLHIFNVISIWHQYWNALFEIRVAKPAVAQAHTITLELGLRARQNDCFKCVWRAIADCTSTWDLENCLLPFQTKNGRRLSRRFWR